MYLYNECARKGSFRENLGRTVKEITILFYRVFIPINRRIHLDYICYKLRQCNAQSEKNQICSHQFINL
jgi:hypothetical protein